MSKVRVRFTKTGMSKYISHLDLLRCFTRSIMRSGLPVVYSQGFNPHMKMTFALPLPVGVTSECEAVDIYFEDGLAYEDIKSRLNVNLPPDIRVINAGEPVCNAADIVCAEYSVKLNSDTKIERKWVDGFFSSSEVIVMKKTKKKIEKPINIMEYVRAWEVTAEDETGLMLRLVLDAGGERNLKPDLVVGAFCSLHPSVEAESADICRQQIFCKCGESEDVAEAFV